MSLRRPANNAIVAIKKENKLEDVLNVKFSNDTNYTNDTNDPVVIDVHGVFISMCSTQWSELTETDYARLQLSPEDPKRFPSSYKPNIYYAVVFKSPFSNFRFFVEKRKNWNVLARPASDLKLYAPGESGWECDRSGNM